MSIFSPSDQPCGIFAPALNCTPGTWRQITFFRAAHLVSSAAPIQNASGELVISFVSAVTATVDWQPAPAGLIRQVHGQVVEVDARAYGAPNIDVRELDRCTVDGARLECVNALKWGTHTEWEFREIGR